MIQVRASSFGGCIKAQVAACLDYTPMDTPAAMQAVFDRGNEHEDANLAALVRAGYMISAEQQEVRIDKLPVGSVVGHIDGLIRDEHDRYRLWESKSPNAWAKFHDTYKKDDWSDPLAHRYAWQISVYMHALEMEACVTCLQDDGTIGMFVIEKPPFTVQDIVDRLISINEWVKIGQLPQLCSSRDYPCPFVYLHEDDVDVVDDPVLDQLASEYDYWAGIEKNAAAEKKKKQALIRDHVTADETVTSGGAKVTVFSRKPAAKYDWDRMRADGIDPDDYLIPGVPSEQVRITWKAE